MQWKMITISGLLVAGLIGAVQAQASCADLPAGAKGTGTRFAPAVYHADEFNSGFTRVHEEENFFERESIVGLWEFEFRLDDGTLFDWGLATWHADGTEIQFSAGRPPSSGDVCMGVYKRVGHSFKLNHVALGLTPPSASGAFLGPANIRATVTLDKSGKTYHGPYSISLYPGNPNDGTEFNLSGKPLMVFSGTVTAWRVSADD